MLVPSWLWIFPHCFFCSSLTKKIYSEQGRWTKEHERKLSISVEMPVFRIIYSGTERYLELICKLGIFVNGESKALKLIKITKSLFQWKNEILGERSQHFHRRIYHIKTSRLHSMHSVHTSELSHVFGPPGYRKGMGSTFDNSSNVL